VYTTRGQSSNWKSWLKRELIRKPGIGGLMKSLSLLSFCFAVLLLAQPAGANTISTCTTTAGGAISCTGSLGTPEDVFTEDFTVPAGGLSIAIQTFGFGGGMNAAGSTILAGGFDSMVALFSAGTILTDGSGNPIASVPGSTQFFVGCPPAGQVVIGTEMVCGDSNLTTPLAAGIYTLLLSDASYIPFAVSPGPPISSLLSDGFSDLTGGVFQTCNTSGDCIADNASFAVDITGLPPASTVPEPTTATLLGCGMFGLAACLTRRASRSSRKQWASENARRSTTNVVS